NVNGSQFFILYKDGVLPPNFTLFGQVTAGLDVVQQVAAAGADNAFASLDGGGGHPKKDITIQTLTMGNQPQPSGSRAASPTPAPSATAAAAPAACKWTPNPDPSASAAPNTDLKDVGTPPASGEPRAGTRNMTINTNLGTMVIQLDLAKAPCTAASFTYLAEKHFFDNTSCHRLVNNSGADPQSGQAKDFHVLQCGDPTG